MSSIKKFVWGFIILMILIFVVHYYTSSSLVKDFKIQKNSYNINIELEKSFSLIKGIQKDALSYLLTGNQKFINSFNKNRALSEQQFFSLKDLSGNKLLDTLHSDFIFLVNNYNTAISYRMNNRIEVSSEIVMNSKALLEKIETSIIRIKSAELLNLENAEKKIQSKLIVISIIVLIGGLLSIFIIILFYLRMNKNIQKREKAEEAFKESEEHYRTLTEMLPQTIFEYDLNGKLIYANRAGLESFKYSFQDFIDGINIFQLIIPEDQKRAKSNFEDTLKGAERSGDEYTALRKDGSTFPVLVYVSLIIKSNNPVGVRGILVDISKLKRSEELLKLSEKRFRKLIEKSPLAVAIYTEDKFSYVNEKFVKMFRFSNPNEIIGRSMVEMIAPDYKNIIKVKIKELQRECTYESYGIRKDGEIFPFQIHLTEIELDNKPAFIWFLDDVTERINNQRKLKTLSRAVEQSPVSVVITNAAGEIEYVNPKFSEITGYSIEEVLGKNPRILQSGKTPKGTYDDLWKTVLSGKEWTGEFLNKKKNNEIYWEGAVISPLIDENGKIIQFVAVKEDVTERKKFETDLITAKEKAEAANRLKSNFLANMSHEIRTPLFGILGLSEILESELSDTAHIELISTIRNSGIRLTDTLNSILDLSILESDAQQVSLEVIDLSEIIKKLILRFELKAEEKKLFLKTVNNNSPVFLKSDKEILTKIFNYLIQNAIKFTHYGGVTISLSTTLDNRINVDIIDTGIGIPEKFLDVIFKPFRQASEGLSRRFEGSGLGLSITKKYIELLGGTISVKSVPGTGSTFSISFPLNISPEDIKSSTDKFSTVLETRLEKLPRFKVLLVEDEKENAQIITIYLKNNFSVEHCFDGNEAVSKCNLKNYDAILLDVGLKGIDGIETLKLIRKINNYYSHIPIIAITAYAMARDKENFLSKGFTHYISKPFNRVELLEMLTTVFEKIKSDKK